MGRYIARRLLEFLPVFFGLTLLIFLVTNHLPGVDPVQLKAGTRKLSPVVKAQIIHQYGLDKPWYEQYVDYLADLAHGDLGRSFSGRPVADILAERYPWTLRLAFAAILVEILFGVGAGVLAARRQRSLVDVSIAVLTTLLVALPAFWLAIGLQYTFGLWLRRFTGGAFYLPASGTSGEFPDLVYYILPAFTMGILSAAYASRVTRMQIIEAEGQDYVRTARAMGVPERSITWKHVMRNAMIPVITLIGMDFAMLLGGAVLVEIVFNWPGVGNTVASAATARDYPLLIGGTTLLLFAVMIINLAVDVSYAFLDPRIRHRGKTG